MNDLINSQISNGETVEIMNYIFSFDSIDGWSVVSKKTGKAYELLEGKSYCGKSTSDIVFIMDNDVVQSTVVNFTYGASFVDEDTFVHIADYINDYENK